MSLNNESNHGYRRGNFKSRKPLLNRSLFKSPAAYSDAEKLISRILKGQIGDSSIYREDRGVHYEDILGIIQEENSYLGYINFDHLIEVYLRHYPQTFKIDDDFLVPVVEENKDTEVEPPELLYFGTSGEVAMKALNKGLQSNRHPFLILTSSYDIAERKADSFADQCGDTPVVITVDAAKAYEDNVSFFTGTSDQAFLVEYISKKYIELPEGFEPEGVLPQD